MQAILLVEERFGSVPPDIRVVQEFGDEMIVTDVEEQGGRRKPVTVRGTSMFLEGPQEAFVRWLKPFDGIWKTSNPMLGDWNVFHIRDDA